MSREEILSLMKKENKPDALMVETDFWSFLENEYPEGDFLRTVALRRYVERKGEHKIYGFFRDEEELLSTLRTIADHYGWVKAREGCKDCR